MENTLKLRFSANSIPYAEAVKLTGYMHAAHCCIYAKNSYLVMGKYPLEASILMQNRFDGCLGFPGGLIDQENDILVGLNRELEEEINLDVAMHSVKDSDHVFSYLNEEQKSCYHLFKMLVSLDELLVIERRIFDAKEYAHETMGFLRAPLYTLKCGVRGFPTFLCNRFAGNARDQLLYFLLQENIMNEEKIKSALDVCKMLQEEKNF